SVPANDHAVLRVAGVTPLTDPLNLQKPGSGSGLTWLNIQGWQPKEGEEAYLAVTLSTRHFGEVTLSSSHTGTNSGPRHFQVQASLDGEEWEDLPGGGIDLSAENPF